MPGKGPDYLAGGYSRPIHDRLQAVPDTLTAVTGSSSLIKHVHFTNLTAGSITVSIRDNQDTPRFLLKNHPIGANITLTIDYPQGIPMYGGIRWQASVADSVDGMILGNTSNG